MIYLKLDTSDYRCDCQFSICRARPRFQKASAAPTNLKRAQEIQSTSSDKAYLQVYNYPQGKICEA
jgi:hypothetical protein